jgi:hypothetical protein
MSASRTDIRNCEPDRCRFRKVGNSIPKLRMTRQRGFAAETRKARPSRAGLF